MFHRRPCHVGISGLCTQIFALVLPVARSLGFLNIGHVVFVVSGCAVIKVMYCMHMHVCNSKGAQSV